MEKMISGEKFSKNIWWKMALMDRGQVSQKACLLRKCISCSHIKLHAVQKYMKIAILLSQIQVQLQQASPQQLRQQVISATPAQLSQVKALVSQAQFEASISRSTSPTQATIQVTSEATQSPKLQAQAQQV